MTVIVMDWIERLESVNRKGKNWKNVIELGTYTAVTCPYSESELLTLSLQSPFIFNMTGDLRTQWAWKRCLVLSAIE